MTTRRVHTSPSIPTALLVVLAIVLAGCTSTTDGRAIVSTPGRTDGQAPTSVTSAGGVSGATDPTGGPDTVQILAAAGIATVGDESSTVPLRPVTGVAVLAVTSWQASNMTREASAHGGILGADLDRIMPMGGAPPLAFVIGAWVATAGDPTAVTAGRLLGEQDWYHAESVVFPLEVLDLFVADVLSHVDSPIAQNGNAPTPGPTATTTSTAPGATTSDASSSGGTGSGGTGSGVTGSGVTASGSTSAPTSHATPQTTSPVGGAHTAGAAYLVDDTPVDNACSGVADFVDGVLSRVFQALKLDPGTVRDWISGKLGGGTLANVVGAIGGFFASFWNKAVDFAEATLRNVLSELTAPVLGWLRTVIGALETITIVMSYLRRWSAPIVADPASNSFNITGSPARHGMFTMTVNKDSESAGWPALLTDCANKLGKPAPTLSKEGAQVTWTQTGQENGLVSIDHPAGQPYIGALDANLSDHLDYTTGTEDALTAKGTLVRPTITVSAHARRTEIDQLADLLTGYLAQNFPPFLQPTITAILGSIFGWVKSKLDEFTAVDGSATIEISHHVRKPPPPPRPAPTCTAAGTAIAAGTYSGQIRATLTTTLHLAAGGQVLPNAGGGTLPLAGTVVIISDGKRASGRLTLSGNGTSQVGLPGAAQVHSADSGDLTATISGSAAAPVLDGTLSGAWATLDAPVVGGSGSSSAHVHAGLHITGATCAAVTGDVTALFRELAAPVSQYLTIGGAGTWTARRT